MKRKKTGKTSRRMILTGILCAGILLCGLGAGISFIEYSSFEYMGKKDIGGDSRKTETITRKIGKENKKEEKIYIHCWDVENRNVIIEASEETPKNSLQFVVEYNPENVKAVNIRENVLPGGDIYEEQTYDVVEYEDSAPLEAPQAQEKTHSIFYVEPVHAYDSDFELLFAYKDEILNNLKDKKFYEYKNATITGVKVLVHPSNEGRVSLY